MNASCVYLSILRSCSDDLFSRVLLRNLFQVQVTGQYLIQMYFGTVWTVWAPKKCFSMYVHVIPKWNIVYKYLKTKYFSRDSNILPRMHWTLDIFGHLTTIIRGLEVSLKYPILNFKKTVYPKNVWMRHCRKNVFHKCFSSILYKNKKELFEG